MKKISIVGGVGWQSTDDEAEQDHVSHSQSEQLDTLLWLRIFGST